MKRLLFYFIKNKLSELSSSKQNERMNINKLFLSTILGALFFCACNEPTLIGSELVEEEQGSVVFTDTFSLKISSVEGDSLVGYSPTVANFSNYLFGDFEDPIFGTTTASFYMRMFGPGFYPDFEDAAELDSVILVLPYDTVNAYGDFKEPFSIEVYEITETISNDEIYYTDTTFLTEVTPLVAKMFQANIRDSLTLTLPDTDNIEEQQRVIPQLRIPLGADFANRLFTTDSLTYESDSLFLETFKGFYLKPASKTSSMISFDLTSAAIAGVDMFFHENDTSFVRFHFPIDRVAVPNFVKDRTGSPVQAVLDDPVAKDTLFFVEGLTGFRAKIELPDLSSLGDVVINKAEMEFTVEVMPGDDQTIYPLIEQLLLYSLDANDSTNKILTDDFLVGGSNLSNVRAWFGGNPQTDGATGKQTYTVSISSHLQEVLSGTRENVLYLETFDRAESIARVAFKNSGAKINAAQLKINYTESTN